MNNLSSDCKSCSFKLLKCILVLKEDIRDVCLGPFLCLCAAARDSYNSGNGKVTFSDLWGDWEGAKKKKKHQTNKWTIQTTFIYLRQSLLRKQITFCRLSGEMAFPFPSPALQGQQLGWVWGEAEANEKKGTHRPLLVPSHCPSFTKQAEGTLFFLPFVTRWRWSGATDPWRILSIPLSLT